jgi:D-glycerate 3-kinase
MGVPMAGGDQGWERLGFLRRLAGAMGRNCVPIAAGSINDLGDDLGPIARSRWDGPDLDGEILRRRLGLLGRAWSGLAADPTVGPLLTGPFQSGPWELLWDLWLPLALELDSVRALQQSGEKPLVQGILGLQGTGKTTLGAALTVLLRGAGRSVLSWSIDDLYLPYGDRVALRSRDRRLIWRGPPGTHDVALGLRVFRDLGDRGLKKIALPRFDKSCHGGQGDRAAPEWIAAPVDIVLFEGWFVGTQPIGPERFDHAPAPIATDDDRAFARRCNERLAAYQPLWDCCDRLLVLYPEDYRASKRWRQEAEQRQRDRGAGAMDDAEVDAFVDYFWTALHPELFVLPLAVAGGFGTGDRPLDPCSPKAHPLNPRIHAVIGLDRDRRITTLRRYPVLGDRPTN